MICFSKFIFSIKAKEALFLPDYKGSTLRGGFGNAFRNVVCTFRNKECSECLLSEKCVYSYIFETPPPKTTSVMRKYKASPHPFVIEPPLTGKRKYEIGEKLDFSLLLIGRASDYLPYFIYTFEELGKTGIGKGRGKFQVESVLDGGNSKDILYSGIERKLKSKFQIITEDDMKDIKLNSQNLTLIFLTPTRIIYDGHLTCDLQFHILIRNIVRRIALLSYFHCNGNPETFDFRGIIERAKKIHIKKSNLRWHDWERYSSRQNTKMKMGGFVGNVTYEGDFKEFISHLKLSEILHVGKGTSFGLGKYIIE